MVMRLNCLSDSASVPGRRLDSSSRACSTAKGSFSLGSAAAQWYANDTGVESGSYPGRDSIQALQSGNFSGCNTADDHLSCAFRNVAKAITKTLNDSAYMKYGLQSADVTYGQTNVSVSYVRID